MRAEQTDAAGPVEYPLFLPINLGLPRLLICTPAEFLGDHSDES